MSHQSVDRVRPVESGVGRESRVPTAMAIAGIVTIAACTTETTREADGIEITNADSTAGIQGIGTAGDRVIRFESRTVEGELRAVITDAETGDTLVEYSENAPSHHHHARPTLVVLGVEYEAYGNPAFESNLERVAQAYGALLRDVAFEVHEAVVDPGLVAERRGLQVPLQAIQTHVTLPDGYINDGEVYANREMFVVKTLDQALVMEKNWMHNTTELAEREQLLVQYDDESRVGECFGRCGGGCGKWKHRRNVKRQRYTGLTWSSGNEVCDEYEITSTTIHEACGCVRHGCARHDWCVRNLAGGNIFDPICYPEAIWSGFSWISCLFQSNTCWSYDDGVEKKSYTAYCSTPDYFEP